VSFVSLNVDGGVATLTLNRPERRNAIASLQDCADIVGTLNAITESGAAVAILTGAGPTFCAGGDLSSMQRRDGAGPGPTPADTRNNYRRGVQTVIRALAEVEFVTIAAINGPAIGLGLDIAALCDFRLVASSAKLASSFVKVGLAPGDGGAFILQRAIGYTHAAELILTGAPIDAARALQIGLVSAVVDDSEVLGEAGRLAARMAANPRQAILLAKRLLREAQSSTLNQALELAAAFQALAHETEDHRAVIDALTAKKSSR
jgi:enoyl-CoA hydratase/carnithine racemase